MATKYSNNLEVQINEPIDTKLVCQNLSDLTDYLYVGLLTYQKSDGKYYYVKKMNNGIPTWKEFNSEGSNFKGIYLTEGTTINGPYDTVSLGTGLGLKDNTISVASNVSDMFIITTASSPIQRSLADNSLILSITTLIGDENSSAQIRVSSNVIKNRVLNNYNGGYIELDFSNLGSGGSGDLTVGSSPLGYNADGGLFIKLGTNKEYTDVGAGLKYYGTSDDGNLGLGVSYGRGLYIDNYGDLSIKTGNGLLISNSNGLELDSSVLPTFETGTIGGRNVKGKYDFTISTLAFGEGIRASTDFNTGNSVMDIDAASPLHINDDNQISLDTNCVEYIDSIQNVIINQFDAKNGFIANRTTEGVEEISLNLGEGLEISTSNALSISPEILKSIAKKQDLLESGTNIKTINNESILGEGNIDITGGSAEYISDFINGGVVNLTTTGDVETIYNSLDKGAIALCIIGDSTGNYPSSTENRINVNSEYCQSLKYFFSTDPRGANVGDLLMITKQSYLSFLSVPALRIIPINDAKIANGSFTGTEGIVTVWDKERINKVDGIEWTANDTRAWLNGVVNTDLRNTKYGYGTPLEDCIKTGVLAYTNATINDIAANWTIFVDCTTNTDGGGYYHLIQTAVCRDEGEYLGRMWKRLGYYTNSTAPEFLEWKEITNAGLEARIAALEAQISSMTTETEV